MSNFWIKYGSIIAPIISVLLAQIIKVIIQFIKIKKFDIKSIAKNGSMPSGHASIATSLLIYLIYMYKHHNIDINLVGISLVLWFITLRDAVGVRKMVGKHSEVLNDLQETDKKLSVNEGHTIPEAIAGIILGILVTIIYILIVK